MAEKKENVTKENAPRGPGIYTEDDGSQTLIGPNGKEVKNPYVDMYLNPDFLNYKTVIKPTLSYLNSVRKDLGYAVVGATALPRVIFQEVGKVIKDQNYKMQIQNDQNQMVWSEKHNKYMSKYDLKIQKSIDAGVDLENSGG